MEALRERTATRYPREHLVHRDQSSLADAGRVVAEAERLLAGNWDVFGQPLRVSLDTIDWLAHPISGVRAPLAHFSRVDFASPALGGDIKFLWEVNRHAEPLRLAQGYFLTRREEFADGAITLLDSWMDQNPPGHSINWVSCLDVAFRAIAWCWIWSLTSESRAWTDLRVGRFLWYIDRMGRFIERYDSVHHSPNTHLTGEALGLLYVGTVFPELRRAAAWRARGIDILREEAEYQFLPDGMHYERCTGYHRYNLEFYLHALAIARAGGEDWGDEFIDRLSNAADVSTHLRRPDGTWPVLGDEDGGSTVRLGTRETTDQCELLVVAGALLRRPELLPATDSPATSVAWWLLDDSDWQQVARPAERVLPARTSASLPAVGYFIARDDWSADGWFCVVDAGPHGGDSTGHAHTDLGHVEVACGRHWLVVDPGCSIYAGDSTLRDWYRAQRAHATLTVDDTELAIPGGPFGWRSVAPTPFAEAADEGSYWFCRLRYAFETPSGEVSHERQVVLLRGRGVIVCDRVEGRGRRRVELRWPLADRADANVAELVTGRLTLGGSRVSWATGGDHPVAGAVEPTRRSPSFGEEVDASALVVSAAQTALPFTIVTSFLGSAEAVPVLTTSEETVEWSLPDGSGLRGVRVVFQPGRAPQVADDLASHTPNLESATAARAAASDEPTRFTTGMVERG